MPHARTRQQLSGFTLIELLVVVALIAIATATVSLSLRDAGAAQLEREGERLAALFETARAEARASGVAVRWRLVSSDTGDQFAFEGLPEKISLPRRWQADSVQAQIEGAAQVQLGPEPLIGAQRVMLSMGSQRVLVATDGLAPFTVTAQESP